MAQSKNDTVPTAKAAKLQPVDFERLLRPDGESAPTARNRSQEVAGVTLLCLLSALGGCTTLQPAEAVYQTAHAVDISQTLEIARKPAQYREKESAWLIGEHPSEGKVLAWGIGEAVIHYEVSDLLLKHEHPILFDIWQCVTIGDTINDVKGNWSIGLKGNFK
jgi:hypothetical protein